MFHRYCDYIVIVTIPASCNFDNTQHIFLNFASGPSKLYWRAPGCSQDPGLASSDGGYDISRGLSGLSGPGVGCRVSAGETGPLTAESLALTLSRADLRASTWLSTRAVCAIFYRSIM